MPLYAIVYKRAPRTCIFIVLTLIVADVAALMIISDAYNFRASYLAPEGYLVWSYVYNKPYFHILTHGVGVLAAFGYMQLVSFKIEPHEEVRKSQHSFLHWWSQKYWLSVLLNLVCGFTIIFCLCWGSESFNIQYKVDMWKDILYFGTCRLIITTSAMLIFYTTLLGHFNLAETCCKSTYMRALSKISFPGGLITGMIAGFILCGQENAIYLVGAVSSAVAFGLVLNSIIFGLILYLLVDYPVATLVYTLIGKRLSYRKTLIKFNLKESDD